MLNAWGIERKRRKARGGMAEREGNKTERSPAASRERANRREKAEERPRRGIGSETKIPRLSALSRTSQKHGRVYVWTRTNVREEGTREPRVCRVVRVSIAFRSSRANGRLLRGHSCDWELSTRTIISPIYQTDRFMNNLCESIENKNKKNLINKNKSSCQINRRLNC